MLFLLVGVVGPGPERETFRRWLFGRRLAAGRSGVALTSPHLSCGDRALYGVRSGARGSQKNVKRTAMPPLRAMIRTRRHEHAESGREERSASTHACEQHI